MEVEKSVKRTSIRRNTQLRTLCADVSNPWRTSRHSTSPLASAICCNNGCISSRRREARIASPRSPWQNQALMEKGNKEMVDMQLPHNFNNLGPKGGTATVTPAASPLKTDAGKHELLAGRQHEHTSRDLTSHGMQTEVMSTGNLLTAQSSSNNSLGVYVKPEPVKHNHRVDRQPYQHLAGDLPHPTSGSRWARTEPATTVLQGWVTEHMPPQVNNQQTCPQGKHSTVTNLQAVAGQVEGLSSGICVSTSVSSNMSAHNSSVQNHMPSYHKPTGTNHPVCHHRAAAASNHQHCNKPTLKTAHSLPRENILTTLTGRSPPQMPASSTLAALPGRNKLYRSPQKFRSPESYQKSGSNTHFSRRGLQASPSDGSEVRAPSVLYKSGDAIVDYGYPVNLESSLRPQQPTSRFINKESLYCTYLHQDTPGQLHVNCQQYKKLVSKETQYSDTESLPGKRTTQLANSRAPQVKDNGSSTEPSGDGTYHSGIPQLRCRAGGQRCAVPATRPDAVESHPKTPSNHDASLRRDDDVDKTSDRYASDSSHCGFKCDSLLKEILKAVTSKLARPAIDNQRHPPAMTGAQLSKASDETMQGSYAETIKTEHDTDTASCLFSRQSNKCANRNQAVQRHVSKSSGSNSALPSLVSYSHKNEPSPDHSTVSLEVKSVNLCFRCSNKNSDKDSSQQINIKWTTSPSTKSKWKAECVEVTGISDRPEQQANALTESSQKLPSRELDQKMCEHDGVPEQSDHTQQACLTEAVANEGTDNNGVVEHATKKEGVASRLLFPNRTKHLQSRPSDTTLTSPSPCKSRQSRYRRTASKHQEDQPESAYIPPADPARPVHEVSKVDEGQTSDLSPQTAEDETNKCLNRRQSCTQLARKAACTCQQTHNEVAYRHRSAAKVLARNPEDSLVPKTEEPYLLLHLDWGVFIIIITTIPMLLLLLSLNFYVRAFTATPEGAQGAS